MRIVIGGDQSGFPLKGPVIEFLEARGHHVADVGVHAADEDADFPDIVQEICDRIKSGAADRGIMVCGTGVGAAIAVNKVPGIRAALCHDVYSAHQCVEHDDVNVLCMGAQIIGNKLGEDILAAFLGATFSTDERFRRRVRKLAGMERRAARELADEE